MPTIKTGALNRCVSFERASVNEDSRKLSFSFSSEEPVARSFGNEVLDHTGSSVRLARLATGGPLLLDHDPTRQIGKIEAVNIGDDRRGHVEVRFGKSALAEEVYQDVLDGIRSNVSVGYQIHRMREEEGGGDTTYRAVDWEPFECSIVSVPADFSVGIGRDHGSDHETVIESVTPTENEIQPEVRSLEMPENTPIEVDVDAIRNQALEGERRRQREIGAICDSVAAHTDCKDLKRQFIENGKSTEEFNAAVLERLGSVKPVQQSAEIGLSNNEVKDFSLMRALRALANPTDRKAQEAAAFEFEASQAAQKRSGKTAEGILLPFDVLKRDLTVGTAADGGNLKGTDHMGGSFIELLRNKMVVNAMGARHLSGLVGDLAIPSQTGAATSYWVAESAAITESKQAFGQVTMAPNTVGAMADISRKLLLQSDPSVEQLVIDDLASVLAIAIDKKALYGDGLNDTPTGVASTGSINTTTFAAAVPTWAEVVAMEGAIETDNALMGSLGYVTTPADKSSLKTKAKDAGSGLFVWNGNDMNGYNAMASSQVTSGDVFFGNWSDLIIGTWGNGLDLTLDPYTGSASGTLRVVALQDVDVAVRHAVSFCYSNDTV